MRHPHRDVPYVVRRNTSKETKRAWPELKKRVMTQKPTRVNVQERVSGVTSSFKCNPHAPGTELEKGTQKTFFLPLETLLCYFTVSNP